MKQIRFYLYPSYLSVVRRTYVRFVLFAIDDLFESRLLASMSYNPVTPLKLEFS